MDCCFRGSSFNKNRKKSWLKTYSRKRNNHHGHCKCATLVLWLSVLLLLTLQLLCLDRVVSSFAVAAFGPQAHLGRRSSKQGSGPMTTLKSEVPKEWESSSLLSTTSRSRNTDDYSSSVFGGGGGSDSGGSLYNNNMKNINKQQQSSAFAFLPLQRPDRATEILGSVLATISFIIYILATSDKALFLILRGYINTDYLLLHLDKLHEMADNIIVALIPMTSGDVVSVAFGEAFAGVFSAVVWSVVITKMNKPTSSIMVNNSNNNDLGGGDDGNGQLSASSTVSPSTNVVVNAVADGDFFVTKAAISPIFVASGMSPAAAGIASVSVSLIPCEIVKFGSRHRQQHLVEENMELELLLHQEQQQNQNPLEFLMDKLKPKHGSGEAASTAQVMAVVPVVHQQDAFIVELFADIIKWLEYDALCNHYGGQLGLFPAVEGALFGTLCAVSSQMYTDLLYIGFGVEGEARQQQIMSRTTKDWWDLYLYRILSVSTLFGMYQLVLSPFESFFESILSGR